MPRGDRTGPLGDGPRTGRGAGYCGGFETPGFMNPHAGFGRGGGYGRGMGYGRGRGYGRGMGFGPGRGFGPGFAFGPWSGSGTGEAAGPVQPVQERAGARETEIESLKRDAVDVEAMLKSLRERIAALEAESKKS
jgi:hypothetical protein